MNDVDLFNSCPVGGAQGEGCAVKECMRDSAETRGQMRYLPGGIKADTPMLRARLLELLEIVGPPSAGEVRVM